MDTHREGLSRDARVLLDAVAAMSSDLELDSVLRRIVESACALTGARYGALGVIGDDQGLSAFITHGISDAERARIGDPPHGRGILGLLIRHPDPIRLPRLQDHAASYGFPTNHPPMTSFLGVPVLIRGEAFGNLYLTEKAGGAEFTEQDQTLVEALASAAGVVVQNARAYAVSERQRAWLEASSRLEQALRPGASDREALDLVAVAARVATGSRAIGVLHARDGQEPHLVSTEGQQAAQLDELLDTLAAELRAAFAGERPAPVPLGTDLLAVAVPVRAALFGPTVLLAVLEAQQGPGLLRTDLDLLASFADQAGLALDRARALQDREQLAIVSDRDRIARDLHDLVIQRLFATGLQLQGVRGQVVSPVVGERIDSTIADLDTTIRDIRSTIFALQRPGGGSSLRARLAGLALEYESVLGFAPTLRTAGPVDTAVPEPVAEHLLAALREALSNAARHAHAHAVQVSVACDAHTVSLTVADDGVGLSGAAARESCLRNLRVRAADLGGSLRLEGVSPHGTSLHWEVPVADREG